MASLEQIAACRAPLARKAWPRSSIDGKGSPATVAMPPASNRLRAKRGAGGELVLAAERAQEDARPLAGRWPGWRRCAPAGARSPRRGGSWGSGGRRASRRRPAPVDWIGPDGSRRSANSETPVIGWRRFAISASQPLTARRDPLLRPALAAAPPASRRGARPPGPATMPSRPAPRSAARRTSCRRPDRATRPSCALLEQDELGVARDAPGEGCGHAQRVVERQHGDAASTAGGGGECRHRAAQDVHVRIDAA